MFCFLCPGVPGTIACRNCKSMFCSVEHQSLHSDQGECFPFEVQFVESVGNYLVATRDLQPLDLILRDPVPWPSAPLHDTEKPVCLSCYNDICVKHDGSYPVCSRCGLPMCGKKLCEEDIAHKDFECQLFVDRNIQLEVGFDKRSLFFYKSLMALRMLIIKWKFPIQWQRLERLMDHDRERRSRTDTWLYFQKCVVNFIRKNTFTDEDCRQPLMQISGLGLGDLCTDDEVHQCIGIINVNGIRSKENGATVGIEENDGCGPYRCIYPTMALLSNSCICNARCILSGRKEIEIRAQTSIKSGEEISIQYQSLFTGSLKRRLNFRDNWYFDCSCARCADPTELGSHLNTYVCPLDKGYILPTSPLNLGSKWVCCNFPGTCSYQPLTQAYILSLEDVADKLSGSFNTSSKSDDFGSFCQNVIEDLTKHPLLPGAPTFHHNHFAVMKLKSEIISQYGNTITYSYASMTDEQIYEKMHLCEEFIATMSKVDRGQSTDWWAVTQFEYMRAQMVLEQRRLDRGELSPQELCFIVSKSLELWSRISQVLSLEKGSQYLSTVAKKAKKELNTGQDIVRFISFA